MKLQELYTENLRASGADEIEWAHESEAENISCVLQSQVSRLFLYQRPFIRSEDVIVTVDVNLFVMASHILGMLLCPAQSILRFWLIS